MNKLGQLEKRFPQSGASMQRKPKRCVLVPFT